MYILVLLIAVLISFCSANSLKCERNPYSRELESIIYTPSTEYYEIGQRLEAEFRLMTPLIFTPKNATYIFEFEQKHHIIVRISDPFKNAWVYLGSINTVIYEEFYNYYPDTIRATLNFPGFTITRDKAFYSFDLWNPDGQLLIVTFRFTLSKDPL